MGLCSRDVPEVVPVEIAIAAKVVLGPAALEEVSPELSGWLAFPDVPEVVPADVAEAHPLVEIARTG